MLLSVAFACAPSTKAFAQLKGGVEHAEVLPPADNRLQVGAGFDDSYFNNVHPNNLWVQIPPWLAGVWETRTETQLSVTDFKFPFLSNRIARTFPRADQWVFGMQSDNAGGIWHFINVPSHRKVLTDKTYEYRHELSKEFPYVDEGRVVARYRFTAFTVNARSGKILRVHQQESLMTFVPVPEGNVRMNGSVKMFQEDGQPRAQSKHIVPLYRTQPYAPIAVYEGIDMRSSFRDYMLSHNLGDKLPQELLVLPPGQTSNEPMQAPTAMPPSAPPPATPQD